MQLASGNWREHEKVDERRPVADADERESAGVAAERGRVLPQPMDGRYHVQHAVIALRTVLGACL